MFDFISCNVNKFHVKVNTFSAATFQKDFKENNTCSVCEPI